MLRDENAGHSPGFLSAAIWHCGKRPTKEGRKEGGRNGGEEKKSPETKLLADEIDLCSQMGKRRGRDGRVFGI